MRIVAAHTMSNNSTDNEEPHLVLTAVRPPDGKYNILKAQPHIKHQHWHKSLAHVYLIEAERSLHIPVGWIQNFRFSRGWTLRKNYVIYYSADPTEMSQREYGDFSAPLARYVFHEKSPRTYNARVLQLFCKLSCAEK